MSRNYLSQGSELSRGDFLLSNNEDWKAIFQDDGNFVIYGWKPIWASNTNGGSPDRLIMQADGNLVMYDKVSPIWSTNSFSCAGTTSRLQLTDKGKLFVQEDGKTIWNSAKSKGMK